jgi:hypothetical protein
MRIEFYQPKPRHEDWRVMVNGITLGLVWRVGDEYIANVKTKAHFATKEKAFAAARKQVKSIVV